MRRQDKAALLIKVIKRDRRDILDKLMRDSVLNIEDRLEERIEKLFETVADR